MATVDNEDAHERLKETLEWKWDTGEIPMLLYTGGEGEEEGEEPPNPYSLDSLYPSKYGYSPHAFNGTTPYLPPTTSPYNVSGKLLSPPYHAVVALENFFLSPQGTGDVGKLVEVFPELYKAQAHIMGKRIPYDMNIIHPFESTLPLNNPIWPTALSEAIASMKSISWSPSPPVPEYVKNRIDYPGDEVYGACLYLLNCLTSEEVDWEIDMVVRKCPFSMVDAGWAGMVERSNVAMREIADITREKNQQVASKGEEGVMDGWVNGGRERMEGMWDGGSFRNLGSAGPNRTKFLDGVGVVNEFVTLSGWYSGVRESSNEVSNAVANEGMRDGMVMRLLNEEDESFKCGNYPIRETSCSQGSVGSGVDVFLNYLASRGMTEAGAAGVGHWIRNNTLDMVCGRLEDGAKGCEPTFPGLFQFDTGSPMEGYCGVKSARTAGGFVIVQHGEPGYGFSPSPPLNTTWVLVIIVAELTVACVIGISCMVFSCRMLKKLRREEEGDLEAEGFFDNLDEDQLEQLGLVGAADDGVIHDSGRGSRTEWEGTEGIRSAIASFFWV